MAHNEHLVLWKKIATWLSEFTFCQDGIEQDMIILVFVHLFHFYGLSREAGIDSWLLSTFYLDFQVRHLKYVTFAEAKPLDEFLDHKWP